MVFGLTFWLYGDFVFGDLVAGFSWADNACDLVVWICVGLVLRFTDLSGLCFD